MKPRVLLDARKARDYGIGRYIVRLLAALAERDEHRLVALARAADAPLFPPSVELVVSEAPHYSLSELAWVRLAIARVRPDLFHAPHYVVPLLPPRRTVVTVHDLMHLTRPEHDRPAKRAYARRMLARAVTSAARLITVSEATRAELIALDGRAAGKSVTIPHGVGPEFSGSVPMPERGRVRATYALTSPYMLFLGNDKPHKNLVGLLDAFAMLRGRTLLAHHLVLAGGSRATAGIRHAEIAARALFGSVHDLGAVPDADLPPLLAEAAALVLPSFTEGFGLPVLEAMACGTPVVCSSRGALPETAGDAALFVDPERPREIAGELQRLLLDDALRDELRRRGLARAARFTWEEAAERTARVYAEVLAS